MSEYIIRTNEGEVFSSSSQKTILDAALSVNVIFEHSCKSGQCGVCKTTILEGEVIEIKPQLALNNVSDQSQFLTCCCAAGSDLLIDAMNLKALEGIQTKISPCKINGLNLLSNDIIEVKLRMPPNVNFLFLEGQHVDIIGLNSNKRSYSIASSSNDKELTLMIKNYKGGLFSDYWFNKANLDDLLRIEGPKGTFFLRDKKKPLVFLATGTGIAPIISILEELDKNSSFNQSQKISLFWGNRETKDFFRSFNFRNLNVDYTMVLSNKIDNWQGESGYVQDVALKKIKNIKDMHVYACGSSKMIDSAFTSFVEAGLKTNQFFSDAFVQNYTNSGSK